MLELVLAAARTGTGRCSISVTSCPIASSERATLAPTLPPPATIEYDISDSTSAACFVSLRTAAVSSEIAVCVGQIVRMPRAE